MTRRFETAVIGAGPAGSGLLVAAAQQGSLDERLARGWAVVDSTPPGAPLVGDLGDYDLLSDSRGTSFIECLESPAARRWLAPLSGSDRARRLIERRDRHVPLGEVAAFLAELADCIRGHVERAPRSAWLAGSTARRLRRREDGDWTVELEREAIVARNVVLATGASQSRERLLESVVDGSPLRRWADRVVRSASLLRRGGRERIARCEEGPWAILGASHSAFSVAHVLHRVLGRALDLTVMHRSPPRIFYPTPEAARAENYPFDDADVCPLTGRVHRLGGLRGEGRDLWRRLSGRRLPSIPGVRMRSLDAARLDRFRWIVPAFGYTPRAIRVEDHAAAPIATDEPLVDERCRVTCGGRPIEGLYAIGLAAGWLPPGEPSFRGETNGVWLYHNVNGRRLLESLR